MKIALIISEIIIAVIAKGDQLLNVKSKILNISWLICLRPSKESLFDNRILN